MLNKQPNDQAQASAVSSAFDCPTAALRNRAPSTGATAAHAEVRTGKPTNNPTTKLRASQQTTNNKQQTTNGF
ncbi:MAG TPA: hypothetical protein DCP31_20220 [Cyanobacteria bacterium UBA8543]|nr:hypothetical protein [Cyanobacteria bacterium UBA8543]